MWSYLWPAKSLYGTRYIDDKLLDLSAAAAAAATSLARNVQYSTIKLMPFFAMTGRAFRLEGE